MSILRKSDYLNSSKKNKIISPKRGSHGGISTAKKVKLPSQHKSPSHKCSQCIRTDAKKYYVSEKEVRWLCIICVKKNQNKNSKEKPHFIQASKLYQKYI